MRGSLAADAQFDGIDRAVPVGGSVECGVQMQILHATTADWSKSDQKVRAITTM